ncbi:hypothetical protein NON00_10130 [Roseomonas sp. GC11]|uniref:hypothetical protein n=1 Tax=Roseomonas sp. GC11 TaxID=2950546 RepID=UPI00210D6474|nr:hypothetical protein [Roseomonas sp. GC11]MCQ4160285.1 hypothetical protein [Roseomonas sp. GC11]
MSAQLEEQDLSVEFGAVRVLDRAGFRVAAGEAFCVVGESGCGKSMAVLVLVPQPNGRVSRGSVKLERFSSGLNRWGFTWARFSDSRSVRAKEAGRDGSSLIA